MFWLEGRIRGFTLGGFTLGLTLLERWKAQDLVGADDAASGCAAVIGVSLCAGSFCFVNGVCAFTFPCGGAGVGCRTELAFMFWLEGRIRGFTLGVTLLERWEALDLVGADDAASGCAAVIGVSLCTGSFCFVNGVCAFTFPCGCAGVGCCTLPGGVGCPTLPGGVSCRTVPLSASCVDCVSALP